MKSIDIGSRREDIFLKSGIVLERSRPERP